MLFWIGKDGGFFKFGYMANIIVEPRRIKMEETCLAAGTPETLYVSRRSCM